MRISTLLGLITCNLIWSANPIMGKALLTHFSPLAVAWLRTTSAGVGYLLLRAFLKLRAPQELRAGLLVWPRARRDRLLLVALGFLPFCFAPLLQMTGLNASFASENALIVAMEPLMTVLLAWLFLKERLTRGHVAAFSLAVTGFAMLSGFYPGGADQGWDPHLVGNLIILASLLGEASYSVLASHILLRYPTLPVFGTAVAIGATFLTTILLVKEGLPDVRGVPGPAWAALFWLGPIGTTFTYYFWLRTLSQGVSVSSMAITLFIQPIVGPLLGVLGLGEHLQMVQVLGALLILAGVGLQSLGSPAPVSGDGMPRG